MRWFSQTWLPFNFRAGWFKSITIDRLDVFPISNLATVVTIIFYFLSSLLLLSPKLGNNMPKWSSQISPVEIINTLLCSHYLCRFTCVRMRKKNPVPSITAWRAGFYLCKTMHKHNTYKRTVFLIKVSYFRWAPPLPKSSIYLHLKWVLPSYLHFYLQSFSWTDPKNKWIK